MIRLMTSDVSALSGIVANGHQTIHLVSSAPSTHSVRWVFPSTAGSQPYHRASFRNPSRLRLTRGLQFTRFWPFRIQASGTAAVPTGPWLSTVYHVRAYHRYYGLIRQPGELRPAWLPSLLWPVFAPRGGRSPRLPFFSLSCVLRPCRYPYPADWPVSFDGSSTGHASLRPFCRDSAVSDMPLTGFREEPFSRRQFSRYVAACTLASAADQSPPGSFQNPTGPHVYGRACPGRGLPQPESAITTRPNHPLPRRDFHPLACQRPKAAHRIRAGQNH